MKLSKKALTALSFGMGALVFATTAFADVALGSGYDKLKKSIKYTSAQMDEGLKSFTLESVFSLKDGEKVLFQDTSTSKFDREKQAYEEINIGLEANGKTFNNYSYSDKDCDIRKYGSDEKYRVTEYENGKNNYGIGNFRDPFKEKTASEIEKIFDAAVGNLKNYVQLEELSDGRKEYKGSLSEAQIPTLISAVSSFLFREAVGNGGRGQNGLPQLESDIFIKSVSGNAVESKSGLLESVIGEVIVTGKDKQGAEHVMTFSGIIKLTEVGSTIITKPDLTEKEVERVSASGVMGISSKYIGKYKNEIVIEKDGKFVKAGERFIEITHVDDKIVSGSYSEVLKPGFESYGLYKDGFTFQINQTDSMRIFTYTNSSGKQETGIINESIDGKIYVNLGNEVQKNEDGEISGYSTTDQNENYRYFDSQFSRVFED